SAKPSALRDSSTMHSPIATRSITGRGPSARSWRRIARLDIGRARLVHADGAHRLGLEDGGATLHPLGGGGLALERRHVLAFGVAQMDPQGLALGEIVAPAGALGVIAPGPRRDRVERRLHRLVELIRRGPLGLHQALGEASAGQRATVAARDLLRS